MNVSLNFECASIWPKEPTNTLGPGFQQRCRSMKEQKLDKEIGSHDYFAQTEVVRSGVHFVTLDLVEERKGKK
ncbi:hypothetical protein Ciccas_000746 [Cichlidogyrus casuarinus]|uniref:Uncharacterized protein n=1 Tax=Cichlidogyrus casuarinus TaxID=1844966 RepID=A0ABD2QM20_9PLAT